MLTLLDLPFEILCLIAERLENLDNLRAFAFTCKDTWSCWHYGSKSIIVCCPYYTMPSQPINLTNSLRRLITNTMWTFVILKA